MGILMSSYEKKKLTKIAKSGGGGGQIQYAYPMMPLKEKLAQSRLSNKRTHSEQTSQERCSVR